LLELCWWDVAEWLGLIKEFVDQGKIRYLGVTNFLSYQLQHTLDVAKYEGLPTVVSLQPQYNLLDRHIDYEVMDVCKNHNIPLLPWSPLGGGWLSGKYQRDSVPTGATRLGEDPSRGVEAYDKRNTERTFA
jgi:aryl-alcohol dehydrogenase-like predicted oxidoreductase